MSKFSEMNRKEIDALDLTNKNASWEDWYEALRCYAYLFEVGARAYMVTDCGEECWKEAYDFGSTPKEAFFEGWSED